MALTEIELGRTGHVAATCGEFMLVWGGYKEHQDNQVNVYFSGSELWAYHALTEKWSMKRCQMEGAPPGSSGAVAVIFQNHLYIYGGYQEEGDSNDLYRLDITNFRWELLHPTGGYVPACVDKLVGWEHNSKLYFFGGFGTKPPISYGDQLTFDYLVGDTFWSTSRGWTNQFISYDTNKNEWTVPVTTGSMPLPRAAHAATLVNNDVYVFGGRRLNTRMNDLHCLNMSTMEWSDELQIDGPLPEGRSWHSLNALHGRYLILYGGFSQTAVPLSDCWIFDISIMKWKEVELPFRKPRLWHSACVSVYDEIVIYGGCTQNILDNSIIAEHAKDIIILRFTPKSLFRLCIDAVVQYSDYFTTQLTTLPFTLQQLLNMRLNSTHLASLDGS